MIIGNCAELRETRIELHHTPPVIIGKRKRLDHRCIPICISKSKSTLLLGGMGPSSHARTGLHSNMLPTPCDLWYFLLLPKDERENMNTNQAISRVLRSRFTAFKNRKDDDYESEGVAKGAALLAMDVGILMNDAALISEAQEVITYIAEWLNQQDEQHDQHMKEWSDEWEKSREVHRQAYQLIKKLVGREFHDPRWELLVQAYQEAFPTFLVRDSVYVRISPKESASRLRQALTDLVKEQRLERAPTIEEIQILLPTAKGILVENTLRYLERALPGYEFRAHGTMSEGGGLGPQA